MIRRLKIKFVCINMLIVTVMLAVIFGLILHITCRNMEEQGNRMIQSIHEGPVRKETEIAEKRIPYFTAAITPQGVISISAYSFFERNSDLELQQIAQQVYEGNERKGVLQEHSLRFSRKPIPLGEEIVFLDISMEKSMLMDLIETCAFISLISYVLFFIISVLLAQWAIRPVEKAWNQQKQFVADASHELKTPLTVIMTNAELLRDPAYDSASGCHFAQTILSMSYQMRGLVEGLLDLARVDNGIAHSQFTKFDFADLVKECLLPFEVIFYEKGLELDVLLEEKISLWCSEPHLRQVVDILLDNAVKYAQGRKPVQIRLSKQGKWIQLCVATAGDDISKEDLKNIFKRFYRIDKARTMNHSYGLGLSIANSIIQQLGGRIWAESRNGINSFYVQLPMLHQK